MTEPSLVPRTHLIDALERAGAEVVSEDVVLGITTYRGIPQQPRLEITIGPAGPEDLAIATLSSANASMDSVLRNLRMLRQPEGRIKKTTPDALTGTRTSEPHRSAKPRSMPRKAESTIDPDYISAEPDVQPETDVDSEP
jgi:hypothetical protein